MTALFIGCDPGLTGGIAALDAQGQVHLLEDLPTILRGNGRVKRELDPAGLAHLLRPIAADIVVALVETVASRPGQGVASVFSLGHTSGVIAGVLSALGIPVTTTTPTKWKREMGLIGTDKEASRAMASRLFPAVNLSRKRDHNLAEALLLALQAWERRA
jgi:crossover junction endodeoxyribonuclease RuvC